MNDLPMPIEFVDLSSYLYESTDIAALNENISFSFVVGFVAIEDSKVTISAVYQKLKHLLAADKITQLHVYFAYSKSVFCYYSGSDIPVVVTDCELKIARSLAIAEP